MKNFFVTSILALCLLSFNVSCDRPNCKNNNPIFDKYAPNEKEYKAELVEQLAKTDESKLTYWMDTYREENNTKYMEVYVQGEGLCAKMVLTVNDSEKGIEGIIRTKGISYGGAELEGLKFDIMETPEGKIFVYRSLNYIID
ncbi:MAG: hypothetical protein V4535_08400 [Bacteroidota bacterium]